MKKIILSMFVICQIHVGFSQSVDYQRIANDIASILRAARSVVTKRKLTNPKDFKISSEDFIVLTKNAYKESLGFDLKADEKHVKVMLEAVRKVVEKANKGEYASKWSNEQFYPDKFLPARFAREVALALNASSKEYILKLTVSDDLLVNPANKADDWERNILNDKFKNLQKSDDNNKVFHGEEAQYAGKKAYRYIIPEFYNRTCLECHGGDEGRRIHAAKIPGPVSGLGGAISVTIIKEDQ